MQEQGNKENHIISREEQNIEVTECNTSACEDILMVEGKEDYLETNEDMAHDADNIEEDCSEDEATVSKKKEYIFPTPEEVERSAEPSVGMVFPNLAEAHIYLNVHGLLNGYSIRKGTNYMKKTYHLECNRSGKPKKHDQCTQDKEEKLHTEDRLQNEDYCDANKWTVGVHKSKL